MLALVQRRGADLPGEAGELARLAGEQEAALRALIAGAGRPSRTAPRPRRWTCGCCSAGTPRRRWRSPPRPRRCRCPGGWPGNWPPRPAPLWTTWGGTVAGGPGC
ncbi:hypothetical protein NKG94_42430 [Micromonospora sp. M12]